MKLGPSDFTASIRCRTEQGNEAHLHLRLSEPESDQILLAISDDVASGATVVISGGVLLATLRSMLIRND